jgi:3-deoxy-D-manno-octulosonic-acid transferase
VTQRVPLTLRAYRLAAAAATPLAPTLLAHRLNRGKEHPARLHERCGEAKAARPPGLLVWVHGASVGEVLAIVPLIDRMRAQDVSVLVTSGTVTSAGLAEQRLPPGVVHQFMPIDAPRFVARFLEHWKPDLALFVESDLWPNMILEASRRHIPMILVNGRLSERSFNRWRYLPGTVGALLGRFDLCLAQSLVDAERLMELGAPRTSTTGNLKLDVPAPPVDEGRLELFSRAIGGRPVVAAASTHPGEEAAVIDAHRRLRHTFPSLLTIIAPRHPERGSEIAGDVAAIRLKPALRSGGDLPGDDTDVYIADTMGELGMIYRLAPIVFMGGSLAQRGGQNPIEAIKLGAAVLHGPHVWNFAEIYATLDQARGAELVADAGRLTVRIGAWLSDTAARMRVAEAAARTVESLGGALDRTLAALDPYLMQLRIEQRSGNA